MVVSKDHVCPPDNPCDIQRIGTYRLDENGCRRYVKGGPINSNMNILTDEQLKIIEERSHNHGYNEGQMFGYENGIIDGRREGRFEAELNMARAFSEMSFFAKVKSVFREMDQFVELHHDTSNAE